MTETLQLAPPASSWQGYTALERAGPDTDWVPFDSGVFVGNDVSVMQTWYESGNQENALVTETEIVPTLISYGAFADPIETFPPTWDGSETGSNQIYVGKGYNEQNTNTGEYGDLRGSLRTLKASFTVPPEIENITGARLVMFPSLSPQANPYGHANSTTDAVNPNRPPETNSYTCPTQGWTEEYETAGWLPENHEWSNTWSAEWAGSHFTPDAGDFKLGTSGSAVGPLPLFLDDLLAEHGDGNVVEVALSGYGANLSPGQDASILFSIEDEPELFNMGVWGEGGNPQRVALVQQCQIENGDDPRGPAEPLDFWSAFSYGLVLSPRIIIEHDPIPGDKPTFNYEYDHRGIVYFDLAVVPVDVQIQSVHLLVWAVYAWSIEDGATVYLVPIDPTDPSQEGPMPITLEAHHPQGLEDKTERAVWTATINGLEITEPQLIEVELPADILTGLEQIGFQFAIQPETSAPFTYHYFETYTEEGSGSPESPYTGPRLRIIYLTGTEIPVSVTIELRGLTVTGRARVEAVRGEQNRRILTHKARQIRGY